ncbi:hypothetical protein EXN66_Car000309 [Channa argus]|uniref:Uncharacterized protein n=1 Tax=Channa argus TaxID=215402 RepID=A0A6G1QYI5_CHAAH|nr:hypothetical protein EXN66_Car000309 [Channa argus]
MAQRDKTQVKLKILLKETERDLCGTDSSLENWQLVVKLHVDQAAGSTISSLVFQCPELVSNISSFDSHEKYAKSITQIQKQRQPQVHLIAAHDILSQTSVKQLRIEIKWNFPFDRGYETHMDKAYSQRKLPFIVTESSWTYSATLQGKLKMIQRVWAWMPVFHSVHKSKIIGKQGISLYKSIPTMNMSVNMDLQRPSSYLPRPGSRVSPEIQRVTPFTALTHRNTEAAATNIQQQSNSFCQGCVHNDLLLREKLPKVVKISALDHIQQSDTGCGRVCDIFVRLGVRLFLGMVCREQTRHEPRHGDSAAGLRAVSGRPADYRSVPLLSCGLKLPSLRLGVHPVTAAVCASCVSVCEGVTLYSTHPSLVSGERERGGGGVVVCQFPSRKSPAKPYTDCRANYRRPVDPRLPARAPCVLPAVMAASVRGFAVSASVLVLSLRCQRSAVKNMNCSLRMIHVQQPVESRMQIINVAFASQQINMYRQQERQYVFLSVRFYDLPHPDRQLKLTLILMTNSQSKPLNPRSDKPKHQQLLVAFIDIHAQQAGRASQRQGELGSIAVTERVPLCESRQDYTENTSLKEPDAGEESCCTDRHSSPSSPMLPALARWRLRSNPWVVCDGANINSAATCCRQNQMMHTNKSDSLTQPEMCCQEPSLSNWGF